MKKLIYSSLIIGSALALASCSADEPGITKGDGNRVTMTVQLPQDLATRFSDGKSINTLHYSVFNSDTKNLMFTSSLDWDGSQAVTVTIDLVPSQTYNVVFFACNNTVTTTLSEDNGTFSTGYAYNPSTGDLKVNYDAVAVNDDAYDAFYVNVPDVDTDYDTTDPINLKRPFAQVNIGTKNLISNFIKSIGYENFSTTLTVQKDNLASGMSLLDGTYTAAADGINATTTLDKLVTIDGDEVEPVNQGFPVAGYDYLSMMYMLVDPGTDGQALLNATFTVDQGAKNLRSIDLSSMPAKPNYQTNVYGTLLTQGLDFTVQLTASYGGSIQVWDGKTIENVDLSQSVININTAPQFVSLIQQLANAGKNDITRNINLTCDIDLGNHPIKGMAAGGSGHNYYINFDGQNHTISNINIVEGSNQFVALFPYTVNCSFKNFTVENAVVENNNSGKKYAGVICAQSQSTTFENITLNNCSVTGEQKAAVCVGWNNEGGAINLINVIVKNSTVTAAEGQAGSLCGYASNANFTDCKAIGCTVSGGIASGDTFTSHGSGCFFGVVGTNDNPTVTFTNCSIEGCTLNCLTPAYADDFKAVENRLWAAVRGANAKVFVDGTQVYPAQ